MNPYKVLEIEQNATHEQIRKAYLTLVKKWHPDQYKDNPLADLAEERLKEVNLAYDMLTKTGGNSNSQAGGNSQGAQSYSSKSSYTGENAELFNRVRQILSGGNITAAHQLLNTIQTKNAEWYYLMGIIQLRQGMYDGARQNMAQACSMDPNNSEYRQAYASLNNFNGRYEKRTYQANNPGCCCMPCSPCGMCQSLICADCCCECMGGDLISCC